MTLMLGATAPATSAATAALTVRVDCYSNPEKTVVRNNTSSTITIRTVGSIYQPYSSEPFSVGYRLAAGKSVTFYTGNGASASSSRTLTRRYIYNNDVGTSEGARVRASNGKTYVDRCG